MLAVHLTFLAGAVIVMLLADREVLPWILGRRVALNERYIHHLHTAMWVCLLGLIASGATMAYPELASLLAYPPFVAKLVFVGVLVVNGVLLGKLMKHGQRPFKELGTKERSLILLSGGVSALSWVAVVSIAVFIFGW